MALSILSMIKTQRLFFFFIVPVVKFGIQTVMMVSSKILRRPLPSMVVFIKSDYMTAQRACRTNFFNSLILNTFANIDFKYFNQLLIIEAIHIAHPIFPLPATS